MHTRKVPGQEQFVQGCLIGIRDKMATVNQGTVRRLETLQANMQNMSDKMERLSHGEPDQSSNEDEVAMVTYDKRYREMHKALKQYQCCIVSLAIFTAALLITFACVYSLVFLPKMRANEQQSGSGQPSSLSGSVQKPKLKDSSPLTTHVLDNSRGQPGDNIDVILSRMKDDGTWMEISRRKTNADGRASRLVNVTQFIPATYNLHFRTKPYFNKLGVDTFYPYVETTFIIVDPNQHYHVPILLSPFAYTTYRGS